MLNKKDTSSRGIQTLKILSLSKQIYDYFLKKARLHYINYIGGTFNILEYLYLALTLILVTMSFFQCKTSLKNMKLTGKSPHNTHTHTHTHTHIRFQSCQIFVLPSTGFEPTPLIHCSTIRLALRPAPQTTRPHSLPIYIYKV